MIRRGRWAAVGAALGPCWIAPAHAARPAARLPPVRALRAHPRALVPASYLVLALLLVAWSASRSPAAGPTAASRCAGVRSGDLPVTVTVGGRPRSALVHVPAGLRRPAPLILAFHGAGGNGPAMQPYSRLSRAAPGMIVAYPTADRSRRRWTLAGDPDGFPDDLGFVRTLLRTLERRLCVDPKRVYATGVSNGGGFAARLACRLGDRIAAIAAVAGRYDNGPCSPPRLISVLEIHGTADEVVPYHGRPPDYAAAVRPWVEAWARRDGCARSPVRRVIARKSVRFDWTPCAARGVQVAHIVAVGGTHAWPGANPPDPGPPSRFSAAVQVVRFFTGRRLGPRLA